MLAGKLVASLLDAKEGERVFFKLGLQPEYFWGAVERRMFQYLTSHLKKYGKLPLRSSFKKACPGIALPKGPLEPPSFYRDKLAELHIYRTLGKACTQATESLNAKAYQQALTDLRKKVIDLDLVGKRSQLIDYADEGAQMALTEHTLQKSDMVKPGILSGWPTLDKRTNGLGPGDLMTVVGRPGRGKTWFMLHLALQAWRAGRVPVFVSMEMKTLPIIQRLTAMDVTTNVGALMQGGLGKAQIEKLAELVKTNKKLKRPFWVVDGALATSADDLNIYCRQLSADILFVDGAYLLRSSNPHAQRWDRNAEAAESIKKDICEGLAIPSVISYQFNREKGKGGDQGLENIAYTDVIGQLSSVVLGLMQDEGVETAAQRRISILKMRSGETGAFDVRWEFLLYPQLRFDEVQGFTEDDFVE